MGKPQEDQALSETTAVDAVDVHVRHDVQAKDSGIRVRHSKLLFKETIFLEGIEY